MAYILLIIIYNQILWLRADCWLKEFVRDTLIFKTSSHSPHGLWLFDAKNAENSLVFPKLCVPEQLYLIHGDRETNVLFGMNFSSPVQFFSAFASKALDASLLNNYADTQF
ncbi:hypothetical protein SAMN04515647_3534 [Cohaesibacter sp. ES.047]|nr:hypothetical protein SAMN04515647_3534 [Cohaesibacter sp. ES.047]